MLAPTLDPLATRQLFFANRVEAEGPDLFFLETGDTTATLRGVRADGTPLSTWPVPVNSHLELADRDGGVVLDAGDARGLLRVPAGAIEAPWRYQPEGRWVQAVGQAPDGTIYAVETTDDEWNAQRVVGLDGRTGSVTFRVASAGRQRTSKRLAGPGVSAGTDRGGHRSRDAAGPGREVGRRSV